jgi:hypothetical protein
MPLAVINGALATHPHDGTNGGYHKNPFARIVGRSPRFEEVAAFLRQRNYGRVSIDAYGLNEAGLPQVPQLAVTRVERLVEGVPKIVGSGDAKRPDAGQRACL